MQSIFQIDPELTLGAITLRVQSLEKMRHYYVDQFGLIPIEETDIAISLSADGKTPLLNLVEDEQAILKPARTSGLYHFALLVPTRRDLANTIGYLSDQGVRFTGAADHLFSEAFYLTDPEGNGIEIYRDLPRDEWPRDENGMLVSASNPIDMEGIMSLRDSSVKGFSEGTVMGHLHFNVGAIPAAKQLFVQSLGFEETTFFHPSALFIGAGGYHHQFAANTWNGENAPIPPANSTGLVQYTVVLSSKDRVENLKQHFLQTNVEFEDLGNEIRLFDTNRIQMDIKYL